MHHAPRIHPGAPPISRLGAVPYCEWPRAVFGVMCILSGIVVVVYFAPASGVRINPDTFVTDWMWRAEFMAYIGCLLVLLALSCLGECRLSLARPHPFCRFHPLSGEDALLLAAAARHSCDLPVFSPLSFLFSRFSPQQTCVTPPGRSSYQSARAHWLALSR